MTGPDPNDECHDPEDVALYIARCRECEEYDQVTDVIVEDGDDGLEPVAVELGCGHRLGIDTGGGGDDESSD